jgi:hypothetical protein
MRQSIKENKMIQERQEELKQLIIDESGLVASILTELNLMTSDRPHALRAISEALGASNRIQRSVDELLDLVADNNNNKGE